MEIHVVEWTRHNTPFLMELNFRNADTLEPVDFEDVYAIMGARRPIFYSKRKN